VGFLNWLFGKREEKHSGPSYLIEFRLFGYPKMRAKKLILHISNKFRVHAVTRTRVVPHITLFGPFTTSNESDLVALFKNVCIRNCKNGIPTFNIEGFKYFEGEADKVIALNVIPSKELKNYRWDLARQIKNITKGKPWDYREEYNFHATIAFRDIRQKWQRIFNYLQCSDFKFHKLPVIRVTLLKGRRILYEFDFIQKKLKTAKNLQKSLQVLEIFL